MDSDNEKIVEWENLLSKLSPKDLKNIENCRHFWIEQNFEELKKLRRLLESCENTDMEFSMKKIVTASLFNAMPVENEHSDNLEFAIEDDEFLVDVLYLDTAPPPETRTSWVDIGAPIEFYDSDSNESSENM